ncbi:hypothetical protein LCGC14_0727130 [marine sediment metagenome]|uniref:Uncharacterized protein n=1 Tax=marine sediment metagenome TaxID=412755 RepID=A0A0F9THV0_9ZZZZ
MAKAKWNRLKDELDLQIGRTRSALTLCPDNKYLLKYLTGLRKMQNIVKAKLASFLVD